MMRFEFENVMLAVDRRKTLKLLVERLRGLALQ